MEGQSEQAFVQQMLMLATAATDGETAAEKASGLMSHQRQSAAASANGVNGEGGLQAASRIWKNPGHGR